MERVGILNGENITYDKDLSAPILGIVNQGIIEGFSISGSGATAEIEPGKALIECTRTNGEKIMIYYESTENIAIDMSGTTMIYIEVNQSSIDDGSSNNEDGTGIGAITTGGSYPTINYIPLYSITSGSVTDDKVKIGLKSELLNNSILTSLINDITTTGNITASAFYGDGSNLTGIVAEVNYTKTEVPIAENIDSLKAVRLGNANLSAGNDVSITQTSQNNQLNVGYSTTYFEVGQGFTTTKSGIISEIGVLLSKYGSPSQSINIEVYSDAGFTSLVGTSTTTIAGSSLTTSPVMTYFSMEGISISDATTYYLKINNLGGTSTNNHIYAWCQYTNPYSGGNAYILTSAGAVTSLSTSDIGFEVIQSDPEDGTKYYLADATSSGKIDYSGFTINSETAGNDINIATSGTLTGFSGLTAGAYYYLSDTPGEISLTPGTYIKVVGKAISTTELKIINDNDIIGDITTSATTGSVTLGNAEGYITVNINGENKKIPYYGF